MTFILKKDFTPNSILVETSNFCWNGVRASQEIGEEPFICKSNSVLYVHSNRKVGIQQKPKNKKEKYGVYKLFLLGHGWYLISAFPSPVSICHSSYARDALVHPLW
jgi:hypothetical protein